MSDLISRQAALNALEALEQDAPSAMHASAIFDCEDTIKRLPSVEPERKTGHWIIHSDDLFPSESTQECSECHEHQPLDWRHSDNYCPNCGIKMEVDG